MKLIPVSMVMACTLAVTANCSSAQDGDSPDTPASCDDSAADCVSDAGHAPFDASLDAQSIDAKAAEGGATDAAVDAGSTADAGSPASDAGVDACAPAPANIVSWWTGEGNATDSTGGNDGTVTGAVTYVAGMVGQGFHFEPTGYVSAASTNLPTGSSDRTIEAWVRFDVTYAADSGQSQGLFFGYGTWGATNETFELLVNGQGDSSNLVTFSQWGAGLAASAASSSNTWYHLALVVSGGEQDLYVNGLLSGTGALTIDTPTATTALIGGQPNVPGGQPPEWLTGDVDELTVYSRALGANEVSSIYAAGAAGKCH